MSYKDFDDVRMMKEKRGLLITLLGHELDDYIMKKLEDEDLQNIHALDMFLDETLTEYFQRCDFVRKYYHEKLYS